MKTTVVTNSAMTMFLCFLLYTHKNLYICIAENLNDVPNSNQQNNTDYNNTIDIFLENGSKTNSIPASRSTYVSHTPKEFFRTEKVSYTERELSRKSSFSVQDDTSYSTSNKGTSVRQQGLRNEGDNAERKFGEPTDIIHDEVKSIFNHDVTDTDSTSPNEERDFKKTDELDKSRTTKGDDRNDQSNKVHTSLSDLSIPHPEVIKEPPIKFSEMWLNKTSNAPQNFLNKAPGEQKQESEALQSETKASDQRYSTRTSPDNPIYEHFQYRESPNEDQKFPASKSFAVHLNASGKESRADFDDAKISTETTSTASETTTDVFEDAGKLNSDSYKGYISSVIENYIPTLQPDVPFDYDNFGDGEDSSLDFFMQNFTTSLENLGHVTSASNYSYARSKIRPSRSNVTSLLDTLMLGYDKCLRPGFGGPPLVIKADIEIRSMGPISEKDMIFSMDCYFRQVWTDQRLSFNATTERVTNVSLNVKMLERIWRPDTIFINGGPSYVHTITAPNKFFRLSYDGTILYSQRLTIKANCPMHLEKFPMDTQKCPLHIASFGYPVSDVIYEWHYGNKLAAVASNDMRLSQFDLKGMPACNMTKQFKGTQHSILTVYFDFRRHTGYFLIQVYVPCCLLVVLSWVSFWINREATSDRISLGATTMLTMTFLVLDSRNDLPKVAYSTALDVYVFMCFCFIFASIVQFAAVHFFTKYGTAEPDTLMVPDTDDEDEDDDDDEAFDPCETPDDYHNSLQPDSVTACLRKMWRCIMSTRSRRFNKNVRNALGLNSVSKIDKVSRVMFPAAFSGLNIVYWMSYW